MWLLANDMDFITEAEFIGGGRADILVLEEAIAIEVLDSELKKDRVIHLKDYPVPKLEVSVAQPWKGL